MTTDGLRNAKDAENGYDFADAWTAVLIDIFEILKSNGELPSGEGELAKAEKTIAALKRQEEGIRELMLVP